MRERWQDDALCAQTDPDAFFPEKGGPVKAALAVCASCTVREECLAYALSNGYLDGVYGGTTAHQRKLMRRAAA